MLRLPRLAVWRATASSLRWLSAVPPVAPPAATLTRAEPASAARVAAEFVPPTNPNEKLATALEIEEFLETTGIEFVREGVMPPDPTGHGLPRYWSQAVIDSNIGRGRGVVWPYRAWEGRVYRAPGDVFTEESNPARHTEKDAADGRVYAMPLNLKEAFPESLAGGLGEYFAITRDTNILIPPTGPEIVKSLEQTRINPAAQFPPYKIITGARGSGKSVLLNYLVNYARANDWVCVAVPDTHTIMWGGKVLIPSRTTPGMIDQHDIALNIITAALAANARLLEQLPQLGVYPASRYLPKHLDDIAVAAHAVRVKEEQERRRRLKAETEAAGRKWDASALPTSLPEDPDAHVDRSSFTLANMLEWGVAHPQYATETFLDFKKELAQVTKFPVMLAIDGIDNLYVKSTLYPNNGAILTPDELSIPAALRVFDKDGLKPEHRLKRGVIFASLTYKHNKNSLLLDQVAIPKKHQLSTKMLTRAQIYGLMVQLKATSRFLMLQQSTEVTPELVEYYHTLSSGSPQGVLDVALLH